MTRLRPLPSRKVIKILEERGFQRIRQKGSHLFLRHPDGRTTLVPIHKKDVGARIAEGNYQRLQTYPRGIS